MSRQGVKEIFKDGLWRLGDPSISKQPRTPRANAKMRRAYRRHLERSIEKSMAPLVDYVSCEVDQHDNIAMRFVPKKCAEGVKMTIDCQSLMAARVPTDVIAESLLAAKAKAQRMTLDAMSATESTK